MEFSEEHCHGLCAHATDRKLKFISSPFSLLAAELLQRVGLDAWKIASGEITNRPMLEFMADSGLPPEFQRATLQTLRHKILFLPANYVV
jgi:N,N'-diacetyllegionaminate synthase